MKSHRTAKRQRTTVSISSSSALLMVAITAVIHSNHLTCCSASSFIATIDTGSRRRLNHHVATPRTSIITNRQRHGSLRTFLKSTKRLNVARVMEDCNNNSNSNSKNTADWNKNHHHPLEAIMDGEITKMMPNDAAAALRQVATTTTTVARLDMKKKNDAQEEDDKDEEKEKNARVAILIVNKLLSIIDKSVFQNQKSHQQQQQGNNKKSSLSIYALVDTLVALAILTDQGNKTSIISQQQQQQQLPPLQQQHQHHHQEQERYKHLSRAVWMQLSSRVVMASVQPSALQPNFPLGPRLSLDCLCAAHTLQLSTSSTTNDSCKTDLYTALCQRLTQGDALSRLSSANLVKCLQSTLLTSLLLISSSYNDNTNSYPTRTSDDDDDSLSLLHHPAAKNSNTITIPKSSSRSSSKAELLLLRALARRFRKGAVRQTMSSHLLLQRVIPCLVMFLERTKESVDSAIVDDSVVDDDHGDSKSRHADDVNLVWEMQRLTFTLIKDLMARLSINPAAAEEQSAATRWLLRNNGTADNDADGQDHVVTARDLAWLARGCSCAVTVGGDSSSNEDRGIRMSSASSLDMVHDYMDLLHQYQNHGVGWNETATLYDVDEILQVLQTWKRGGTIRGDDDEFASIVQNLGAILVHRLEQQQKQQQHQIFSIDNNYPINHQRRIVTSILRNAALMYRSDPVIMKDFIHAWEMMLLVNDRNIAFWTQCHISELANWVWFAYMTRCCSNSSSLVLSIRDNFPEKHHQECIVRLSCLSRLGRLILQPETVAKCTPKLACRILSSYTAIVSLLPSSTSIAFPSENDEVYSDLANDYKAKEVELREILHNLFTRLGEYLLSQRISPLDVTRAIVAYAKAPYVEDMGIFDHLVEVLVTKHLYLEPHQHDQKVPPQAPLPPPPPPLPVRSVAQCLWACGKMATLDEQHNGNSMTMLLDVPINRIDFDTMRPNMEPPPYLDGARDMAYFLMDHCDELSTKDTAQALWALAHLQIPDASAIVETLVQRIKTVGPHMTAQEVANSLWALSKLRSNNFDAVFILSQRVIHLVNNHDDNNNNSVFTPPEAASILYALGRLHLRQEEIFGKLSNIILQQIDTTTALTVANVLWAHRAVYILPPQALLDTWAKQKLGLKAIADEQHTQDYYYSSW